LYNTIKYKYEELILSLSEIKQEFESIEKDNDKEKFYYKKREEYNMQKKEKTDKIRLASLFVFLNKTCFRGVYRENSKGEYNVPYGNYKSPSIFDPENIRNLSLLFNKYQVQFINDNYENIINKNYGDNSFIYLDPPYYPETSTSFTKYSFGDFTQKDHQNLFNTIKSQDNMFLLSNSYTETVVNEFKDYTIDIITAKRSINSKKPESKTNEVLIKNYMVI
jgi:DNA adenine methylase